MAAAGTLFYPRAMQKYGIAVEQLGPQSAAAVLAAEHHGARTLIYRDGLAVAAVVPMRDVHRIDPVQLGNTTSDPLLALCGTCHNDAFVDAMSELSTTVLFRRTGDPTGDPTSGPTGGNRPLPPPRKP